MKNLKSLSLKQIFVLPKFLSLLFALLVAYNSTLAQKPSEKKTSNEGMHINTDSILKEAHDALKNINFEKINIELQSALKVFDTLNIKARINEALAAIDFAKVNKSLDSAIKKMQSAEIKQQLELSRKQLMELQKNKDLIRKVDMEKIRKEIKETQIQIDKMRKDLQKEIKAKESENTALQMNFRD